MLHLGKSSRKPPKNITVKQVSLKEMPKYINQCKTMIVPYKNYESEPRVISESLKCHVKPFVLDSVNTDNLFVESCCNENIWIYIYNKINAEKINDMSECGVAEKLIFNTYKVSVETTSQQIRNLIER